jgi:hypothetical protein
MGPFDRVFGRIYVFTIQFFLPSTYNFTQMDGMFKAGATVLCLVILSTVLSHTRRRRPSNFLVPPGPRGYPIIGNLVDMPSHQAASWLTFAKWGEIYGTYLL